MKQSKGTNEETCRRKRNYTKKKAKHVLKLMRTNEKGVHGSIYRCPVGDHWHLTRWPKKLYEKLNGGEDVDDSTDGRMVRGPE